MMIGDNLSGESRLTKLLQSQPNVNNGTIYGGLAHVLKQALMGYEGGKDSRSQQAATDAYVRGMTAQPWTNPDTGEVAPAGSAGGQAGAMAALQGQQNNPYARNLAMQLMMEQAQGQAAESQWQNRFDAQNQAQDQRFEKQSAAQDARLQQQLAAQEKIAGMKAETAGKYYAVPTGSGTMLLDKGTGMAIMLGVDDKGQPVQIGQPFRPAFTGDGQPIPIPQPGASPDLPPQSSAEQPQQPANVRPLMPPSIDAPAQGAASAAKAQGAEEGKFAGTLPQRARAASSAMNELQASQGVVMQDIDKAISMANGGGMLGTTGMGSALSGVPNTSAHDLASTLNTIKSNIGFDKLQAMREASPTGGALGQVSERENVLLQSVLGSLDQSQSREQFVGNLQRLKEVLQGRQAERERAYLSDFGNSEQAVPANGGWSIQKVQ